MPVSTSDVASSVPVAEASVGSVGSLVDDTVVFESVVAGSLVAEAPVALAHVAESADGHGGLGQAPRQAGLFVALLDDVGHRHRLPRSGDPEERLEPVAADQPPAQLADGLRLVAGRLEWGLEVEFGARHRARKSKEVLRFLLGDPTRRS